MNRKLQIGLALLVSWAPGHGLRRALYQSLLGYRIDRTAKIGWRTTIAVDAFEAGEEVRIDRYNVFRGPMTVRMDKKAWLGRLNRFTTPWHLTEERFARANYTPRLIMGEGALFMDQHEVDLFGVVQIGSYSWFGGIGSQLWTHGLSVKDRDIIIGDRNYIGASTCIGPGARLGNDNAVALGSVVLSKLEVDAFLIAGNPARPVRSIRDEIDAGHYNRSFSEL